MTALAGWSSNARLLTAAEGAARLQLLPHVAVGNADGDVIGWLDAQATLDVPMPHSDTVRALSGGSVSGALIVRWDPMQLTVGGHVERLPVDRDPGQPGLAPSVSGAFDVGLGGAPGRLLWDMAYRLDAARPEHAVARDRHGVAVSAGWRLGEHGQLLLVAGGQWDFFAPDVASRATDLRATTVTGGLRLALPLGRRWFMTVDGDVLARLPEGDADSLITGTGRARFGVDIGHIATISVDLARQVEPSAWGEFVVVHNAALAARVVLGDDSPGLALRLGAAGRYTHGAHPPLDPPSPSGVTRITSHHERTEELVAGEVSAWLRVAPHLWVGGSWSISARLSEFRTQDLAESARGLSSVVTTDKYTDQTVLFGVRVE